jgi:hypothetical protein
VINNWTNHATTANTSPEITLQAGTQYTITMEYYDYSGTAVARLRWRKPGQTTFPIIPATSLTPN